MSHTAGGEAISNSKSMKNEELSPLKSEDEIISDGTASSKNMIEIRNFAATHIKPNISPLNLTKAPEEVLIPG